MKHTKVLLGSLAGLFLGSLAHAQSATIPTASSMTTDIGAIGGVAAAAAALGFSIWLYRKVKAKAGQAIG
jgi:hypothetical protein